ncbi:hypothetical protein D3C73_1473560 [compost metagenome]
MTERNGPAEGQEIRAGQRQNNQYSEVARQPLFEDQCSQPDRKDRLKLLQQQHCVQISAGQCFGEQNGRYRRTAPGYDQQCTGLTQADILKLGTVAP